MMINAIGNSQTFGKKADKSEKTQYKRTDFFKTAGAIVGGVGTAVSVAATGYIGKTQGIALKGGPLGVVTSLLIGAGGGALAGTLTDFVINKIVKNVTESVNMNKTA